MIDKAWAAVDDYFVDHLLDSDPTLDSLLAANAAAGLPTHDVTPSQGKMLNLLARLQGARRILEIGTLGGYSSVWLARALTDEGKLITLEVEPRHADVAKKNFERAGVSRRVELHLGDAIDSLAKLYAADEGPFDFVFIDADKKRNSDYFSWALKLCRNGALIIIDNVVRDGAVVDHTSSDPSVIGVRTLVEMMEREPNVCATALQTVGSKGYDGFIMAIVGDSSQSRTRQFTDRFH